MGEYGRVEGETLLVYKSFRRNTILVWSALLGAVFADQLTGYLLQSGFMQEGVNFSPSQLFRMFVCIGLVGVLACSKPMLSFQLWLIAVMLFLIQELVAFYRGGGLHGFVLGGITVFKVLLLPLVYIYARKLCCSAESRVSLQICLLATILFVSTLILISSVFGLGAATYADEGGVKAYFPSGNGLGVALGLGFLWMVFRRPVEHVIARLLVVAVCASALMLVGTKASAVFAMVGLMCYVITERGAFGLLIKLVSPVIAIVVVSWMFENYDVVKARYERTATLSIFLLSHRDARVADAFSDAMSGGAGLQLVVGGGALASYRHPAQEGMSFEMMEQDWADLYFFYGLPGLTAYAVFCAAVLSAARFRVGAMVTASLLIAHSILAGHVMLNGMVAMFAGFILADLSGRRERGGTSVNKMRNKEIEQAVSG